MPLRQLQLRTTLIVLTFLRSITLVHSGPAGAETALDQSEKRDNNPLHIDWSPAPSPGDGPAFSAGALRDTKYLPVQIAGLIAAYGVSLVLVAITLLSLAKKRREHLQLGVNEIDYQTPKPLYGDESPVDGVSPFSISDPPREVLTDSSHPPPPPPVQIRLNEQPLTLDANAPDIRPLPTSACHLPAHNDMAESQLDEMYRHVLEHEDAMQRGVAFEGPVHSGPRDDGISRSDKPVTSPRKDRVKPASLKLKGAAHGDKAQSKTSAFFAALRSPRKKQIKGVHISSPIMTPQSATFPGHESQEMSAIPPRRYAPLPPPPIPTDQTPFAAQGGKARAAAPNLMPENIQHIDQRMNSQPHASKMSLANSEADPVSAASEHSHTPLVGGPSWHKSDGNLSFTLPLSPKPGATFSRANTPSAVRTDGDLPLRAYEPAMGSPVAISHTTKQIVFERRGPLSPTTGRTPMTAGAVPYSPYQPFTPVVPITPSLVTKEDRKRMKKLMPKTPTVEMVKDPDEIW
ncbi:hypothetical protein E4U43_001864 [Claviceps pusilla]|uniref:Uncharacterized protein n=1 Tax=Claviceps pusilla TaxID=123648 RepID=A0A9P7SYX1_9HYPO|nr:hypothetical protein E4U43_001864 [Claviceps pusilla]